MLTYTGQYCDLDQGSPTLRDIAIQLGRIPRFMGGLKVFWPILAHSLLVARLCPPEAKLHGLLHDAAEVITGDIPRTIKTAAQKSQEKAILCRIYSRMGVPWPSLDIVSMVKEADNRALRGEAWALGSEDLVLHSEFHPRDREAEQEVFRVMMAYPEFGDYLHPAGKMVRDYVGLVEILLGIEPEAEQTVLKFEGVE